MLEYTFIALLGLCIGSFLNVVIYRLPIILKREWQTECQEFLGMKIDTQSETYSLAWPPSHCPHCQAAIKPWHNLPVLGYCFLKGRCHSCQSSISIRYPFIECLTACLALVVVMHFSLTLTALWALLFSLTLIVITMIDWDHQLIPDRLSLGLLWAGLLMNTHEIFATPNDAILGAIAGYSSLALFTRLFKLVTGKVGMGQGDFKLLAAFGAWLGWQYLLMIILIATTAGAILGIGQILMKKMQRDTPMPFGPFLALGGWIALIYGPHLLAWYWSF